MQLLLSFTSFYEVFSDSILVNTLLLIGSVSASCSCSWLCHPIPFLLPTLLFVGSLCDLIQFINVGENCQWRGSGRPFHTFSNSEPEDQFSLLRQLQPEPSGTWSCLHWGWQQNSTWSGCRRSSFWAPVLHVVIWNSPGIGFVPPWS